MLNIIEFVKTDVITHCWQNCALSRDGRGNHPLHTHARTHTLRAPDYFVNPPLVTLNPTGRGRPLIYECSGNNSHQENAEHLGTDNQLPHPWFPYMKSVLIVLEPQEISHREYRITTSVKQHWRMCTSRAWKLLCMTMSSWGQNVFSPFTTLRPAVPPEMSGSQDLRVCL